MLLVAALTGCATVAPPRPRFIAVFEQKTDFCRIHIVQDTRSSVCFVVFRCGRQPVEALVVEDRVCVP